MAHFVSYRCPDCGGVFRHFHHPSDAPPPDRCPLCHAWVSEDEPPAEVFIPQAPGIRKSPYARAVDQSYRAMEESSIQRAEDAADQLRSQYSLEDRSAPHEGDPALLADFQKNQIDELKSGLKITNMKDPSEMREGDTAVSLPSAGEAAKRLSNGPSAPGFQTFAGPPPNHAPGVGPGNSGDATRQALAGQHGQRSAAMIAKGNMGSFKQ